MPAIFIYNKYSVEEHRDLEINEQMSEGSGLLTVQQSTLTLNWGDWGDSVLMTCSVKGILFNIMGNTCICFLAVSYSVLIVILRRFCFLTSHCGVYLNIRCLVYDISVVRHFSCFL